LPDCLDWFPVGGLVDSGVVLATAAAVTVVEEPAAAGGPTAGVQVEVVRIAVDSSDLQRALVAPVAAVAGLPFGWVQLLVG